MHELNRKKNIENKKYILEPNLNIFGINKIFINKFLTRLWEYPEAMYHILIHSDPQDIKTSLAPLIVDNFYINNLSANYIENNLLYILTLMIKDEVDKLTNLDEVNTFLDNTRCGYLLEELIKKPDIQIFFNKVILKTIETLERTCSYNELKFNLLQINDSEKKKDSNLNEDISKIVNNKLEQTGDDLSDDTISGGNDKENESFVKYYVSNISTKEFEKRGIKAKSDNNNDLYNYFHRFEEETKEKDEENKYANSNLTKKLFETSFPSNIVGYYRINFMKVVTFIEQLIDDLMKNILLLPYSVKCICKIISVLIRNKFKHISKAEENGFISKFLLGRLLIPIISSPSFNALISDFVISGNTEKNIKTITIILSKLFSGHLFLNNKDEDYTPFNWFFLDKMESILNFYMNATNVNLPNFIEKFINGNLPEDYQYNFFDENKEEIYANISICFNIHCLSLLIEGLRKSPEIFSLNNTKSEQLKKVFDKVNDKDIFKEIEKVNKKLIDNYLNKNIKNNKEKSKCKEKVEIDFYFLHLDKAIEEKYNILFKLDNKIANFYIDLKKLEKEKVLNQEVKNIIKIKNYLCSSLGNYRLLNIADFNKETTSDTVKMLNEIKSYMALPNFILNNNTIPSTWYINSILDYLNKIPEDYKKNDYEKLYNELKDNLNESINILDFQRLIMFRNKLKLIDKIKNYYDNVHNLIINITINEKIKNIVEKIFIPFEMYFKYSDGENDNKFELKSSNVKEKIFGDKSSFNDPKKKCIIFRTIEAFTNGFPNLNQYQIYQDKDPLEIVKELEIPEKMNHYFEFIKTRLIKKENISEEDYDKLYQEKIKDYVMNKIYEKIYPLEPSEIDRNIFKKATMLSWVEPHLVVDKEYIYDNILPDILNQFNKIVKVKTPLKKLKCIREIFELIQSLIQFNEGESKNIIGSDDITPVLNYAFIKASPFRIYTDLEFVKIFLDIKEGQGGYDINQLESAYTILLSYKPESFKLTPEEYQQKCEYAANNIKIDNN